MHKTARRFLLQPLVEGLDHRIAPSSVVLSPISVASHAPTHSTGGQMTPSIGIAPSPTIGATPPSN